MKEEKEEKEGWERERRRKSSVIFPHLCFHAPPHWNSRERRCRGGNQGSKKFINLTKVTPHCFYFQTSSQAPLLQGISVKAAGSRCPIGTRSWLSILPPGVWAMQLVGRDGPIQSN